MITLERDHLVFRFPEVHEKAFCSINLTRTLRIPDDDKTYPLPPGFGSFPLRHLNDYAASVPDSWVARGGVITPMHQAEAMWIRFIGNRHGRYPFAIKVAAGKINAISGDEWTPNLNSDPQDYVVIPDQPWLDGYSIKKGMIRQFVAMPLGSGYSAEEQITGKAEHGGLQIIAYPMKRKRYEEITARRSSTQRSLMHLEQSSFALNETPFSMGLAPGGRMKQHIERDRYGLDAWDQRHSSKCFVTIANSMAWLRITGEVPPTTPPAGADYTAAGLPWFDFYGSDAKALEGAVALGNLKSVASMAKTKGEPLPQNESIDVEHVIELGGSERRAVRESSI